MGGGRKEMGIVIKGLPTVNTKELVEILSKTDIVRDNVIGVGEKYIYLKMDMDIDDLPERVREDLQNAEGAECAEMTYGLYVYENDGEVQANVFFDEYTVFLEEGMLTYETDPFDYWVIEKINEIKLGCKQLGLICESE